MRTKGSAQRSKSGADAVGVIECAYALEPDEASWLDSISRELVAGLDQGFGIASYIVEVRDGRLSARIVRRLGNAPPDIATVAAIEQSPDQAGLVREHLGGGVSTATESFGNDRVMLEHFRRTLTEPLGIGDVVAYRASDGVSVASGFCVPLRERRIVTIRERRFWSRVGAHVAAGLRLRARLGRRIGDRQGTLVEAVLRPDGRLEHAESPAEPKPARERLRVAVKAADRARGKLRTRDPEAAVGLWRGLVAGRWSLVDRFESDGRRFVVACKNPIELASPRALSEKERQVAHLAALGRNNARIGYELGFSETTVATHLAASLRKLGIRSRTALCTSWAEITAREARRATVLDEPVRVDAVSSPKRAPGWLGKLTPTEREVAKDVLEGFDNAAIAQRRGTSPNTVMNQLGSIYRKLGVRSRAGLAALE